MRYINLLLFFCLSFSALQPAQAQESLKQFDPCAASDYRPISETYERGLFFRISKCVDGKKLRDSYILGTMHSDLPQVRNAIPKLVWQILPQAKSASFELKEDSSMQAELSNAMYYDKNSGKNLRAVIGDEFYGKLVEILKKNRKDLTEDVYANMKPWAIGLLMQVPADNNDGVHLDSRLENLADSKLIPVFGLETVQEQLGVFTQLSEAEQIEFLREAFDNFSLIEEMNNKMLSRYLEHDLNGLQKLAVESFNMMRNENLRDKLRDTLITKRNLLMAERMQPRLMEGNAFVAVGALHLPTEIGLLELLEKRGYYIHAVNH